MGTIGDELNSREDPCHVNLCTDQCTTSKGADAVLNKTVLLWNASIKFTEQVSGKLV